MNTQQMFRQEIIGSYIEVIAAKNTSLIGKKGKIIDETRNTLELENNVSLLKEQIVISLNFEGQIMIIDGKLLVGRSEERLKKSI